MGQKINSFLLKTALLSYFRFKRQWLCVDECIQGDVVADTGKEIYEVEVKVSKKDLIQGEKKKKEKHLEYGKCKNTKFIPNKYFFCVPSDLYEEAKQFVEELNPNYGIIVFDIFDFARKNKSFKKSLFHLDSCITIMRNAKPLHKNYSDKFRWQIAKRASSSIICKMQKELKKDLNDEK